MDVTRLILPLFAVVAGACIAVQFAVNSQLGRILGSPLSASVVSFVAGLVALLAAALVFVRRLPETAALREAPGYVFYLGGVCGAVFVAMAIVVTPRLGTAATLTLAILGQITAALLIDQFNLFGTAGHPISLGRLLGAGLVLVGALLVRVL